MVPAIVGRVICYLERTISDICASTIGVDLIGKVSTGNLKVNSACGSQIDGLTFRSGSLLANTFASRSPTKKWKNLLFHFFIMTIRTDSIAFLN